MASLFQLTHNSLSVATGQKVIKAKELQKFIEAQNILDEAKQRAALIIENAEKEYQIRKEQGYVDGQNEGKLEHAEKIMETVLSSLAFIEKIESTVVEVVTESIQKVIGELDENERIVRIVRTALQNVRNQQQILIRVSPHDEKIVREALAPMLQHGQSSHFLDVIADSKLTPDSCILETELGVIDASLSTQLKALENAFNNKIRN